MPYSPDNIKIKYRQLQENFCPNDSWLLNTIATDVELEMLEVKHHAARGRGLYTTRHVQGGEVLLREGPLLLTVAHAMKDVTCAMCLRHLARQPAGAAWLCFPEKMHKKRKWGRQAKKLDCAVAPCRRGPAVSGMPASSLLQPRMQAGSGGVRVGARA
jgi:hypothetical protein